jgi:hypothetical protein
VVILLVAIDGYSIGGFFCYSRLFTTIGGYSKLYYHRLLVVF